MTINIRILRLCSYICSTRSRESYGKRDLEHLHDIGRCLRGTPCIYFVFFHSFDHYNVRPILLRVARGVPTEITLQSI